MERGRKNTTRFVVSSGSGVGRRGRPPRAPKRVKNIRLAASQAHRFSQSYQACSNQCHDVIIPEVKLAKRRNFFSQANSGAQFGHLPSHFPMFWSTNLRTDFARRALQFSAPSTGRWNFKQLIFIRQCTNVIMVPINFMMSRHDEEERIRSGVKVKNPAINFFASFDQ